MRLASFISQLTEPMVLVTALVVSGAWQRGLRGIPFVSFVMYVGLFFLASLGLRIFAVRRLKTNWDISDREKRVKSLVPFVGICAVFFLCMLFWRNGGLIQFGMTLILWMVGFVLITLRTKISGHLAILTLTLGYAASWYGYMVLPAFGILPFVAWSRLVLKRHTMIEVIGGIMYSLAFLMLIRFAGWA